MLPQSQQRKKRNSSKVNLLISFIFHALIVVAMFYFAARQGLLGKQMKKIAVEMVKEKPPEKPKEPEKPKVEPPKMELPKVVEKPKVVEEAKAAPPPPTEAPPTVAPAAAELPAFQFGGGKTVETSSDPVKLYQGALEYALRSKWNRPDNLTDDDYVAEVDITVNRAGDISNPVWRKSSGDPKWDDSVRQAIAAVKEMDRPPPTNFPSQVLVRFDVQEETEPVLQ
ncbi:MAG: TonB C-terminal domain-containing protein [Verrucomicrobiota bacterium]|jgi:outer membrane biosynthesis protein TonB